MCVCVVVCVFGLVCVCCVCVLAALRVFALFGSGSASLVFCPRHPSVCLFRGHPSRQNILRKYFIGILKHSSGRRGRHNSMLIKIAAAS